jgi:hypothetical protein
LYCEKKGIQLKQCGRCKTAYYCSTECQKKDYKDSHNLVCIEPRQMLRLLIHDRQQVGLQTVQDVQKGAVLYDGAPDAYISYLNVGPHQVPKEFHKTNTAITMTHRLMENNPRLATLCSKRKLAKATEFNDSLVDFVNAYMYDHVSERGILYGSSFDIFIGKINHSCIPNCCVERLPNRMVVIALCDIPAKTEVTVRYYNYDPFSLEDYTTQINRRLGFICNCGHHHHFRNDWRLPPIENFVVPDESEESFIGAYYYHFKNHPHLKTKSKLFNNCYAYRIASEILPKIEKRNFYTTSTPNVVVSCYNWACKLLYHALKGRDDLFFLRSNSIWRWLRACELRDPKDRASKLRQEWLDMAKQRYPKPLIDAMVNWELYIWEIPSKE